MDKENGVYRHVLAFKYVPGCNFRRVSPLIWALLLDPISVMMLVIVSFYFTDGACIQPGLYERRGQRCILIMHFLSLFTFSMLGLVLSSNIFQLYIFWELVGVSSYLLIGFYFDKPSAVAASKKAFIVTRFADLGFLIGILILAFHAETLDVGLLIERCQSIHNHPGPLPSPGVSFMSVSALTWGLVLGICRWCR